MGVDLDKTLVEMSENLVWHLTNRIMGSPITSCFEVSPDIHIQLVLFANSSQNSLLTVFTVLSQDITQSLRSGFPCRCSS